MRAREARGLVLCRDREGGEEREGGRTAGAPVVLLLRRVAGRVQVGG